MPNSKKVFAVLAVLITIMLVGEGLVCFTPYEYSSDVQGNQFTIRSTVGTDYRIIQFTNPSEVNEAYVYYDSSYQSLIGFDEKNAKYAVKELELRNIKAKITDAVELRYIIENNDPKKTCLVFLDGEMPDTVYSGNPADPIFEWFDNGGNVMWVGKTIGCYYSTKDGIITVGDERYSLFFGQGCINEVDVPVEALHADNGLGSMLCLQSALCSSGMNISVTGMKSFGFVSDEGYCSASVVQFHNGHLAILGGTLTRLLMYDMAQMIASGVTEKSEIIMYEEIRCNGTSNGILQNSPDSGAYIFSGGDFTTYGKGYII